jgi:16S rRNA (cytosine967-C5)-methyltransferase
MSAPARACAYQVLRRVFEHGAYADEALHAAAKGLDHRDRSLAMRLSYGAVQRAGTTDHLIEQLSERPAPSLDRPVIAALRLGLYELLYLDGSPDYAVVADAVELSKRNGRGGHGLVNAVLRRAAREGASALLGALGEETPEAAAVKHSHPEWIARLWWEELGPDAARALMAFDNEPSEVALRANSLVTDASSLAGALAGGGDRGGGRPAVQSHLDPEIPEAVVLDGPFDARSSPLFSEGAFLAQSRAAMRVARALLPQPGERVLDLCAAPGGKTTHLAALMGDSGEVVAVERNRHRAGALLHTARRMRAGSVRVEVADAATPRAAGDLFDRVLVDPPCTGLGTLQARADLRWRATPERAQEMEMIQSAVLGAGAQALRPGGVLVYSTCTISSAENERRIATFLDSHPNFTLDDLGAEHPRLRLDTAATPAAAGGRFLLTLPHRDHTAGFFIARMRRA